MDIKQRIITVCLGVILISIGFLIDRTTFLGTVVGISGVFCALFPHILILIRCDKDG